MKKTGITLGLIIFCSLALNAQKKARKWDGMVYDVVRSYKIEEGKPVKKETYVFKNYEDKEKVVMSAYKKLSKKYRDGNYSAVELERDKKELVNLMKGKVEEPVEV